MFMMNQDPSQIQVHHKIGVCPQFDPLWDTLTPYEHLQIYGGLKGL